MAATSSSLACRWTNGRASQRRRSEPAGRSPARLNAFVLIPVGSTVRASARNPPPPRQARRVPFGSQANLFTDDPALFDDDGVNLVALTVRVPWPTGKVTVPCTPSSEETCTLPKVTVFL